MIIANSLTVFLYLFTGDMVTENFPGEISTSNVFILGVLGLGNVIFSILLFKWKKIGFWGFLITVLVALSINLNIGLGIGQSLIGLIGIVVLYAVLQIKRDGVTAWDNLE